MLFDTLRALAWMSSITCEMRAICCLPCSALPLTEAMLSLAVEVS